jgi:hypothetical protein
VVKPSYSCSYPCDSSSEVASILKQVLLEPTQVFRTELDRGGMRVLQGIFPCTFKGEISEHPVATIAGRRIARFRRHIEGGIRYHVKRGRTIYFTTVAMRYNLQSGDLAVHLNDLKTLRDPMHYCVDRFIQILRRGERWPKAERLLKGEWKRIPVEVEYLRVLESTQEGVTNHAHLVLAVRGEMPSEHDLKDVWSRATYGTSFEVKNYKAHPDIGELTRYLSKALGSYLSKSFPEGAEATEGSSRPEGLDQRYQIATGKGRVSDYVSTSRNWLPEGAEREWKRLFKECAWFWLCDKGFYHTDLGDTSVRWLEWIDRQGRMPDPLHQTAIGELLCED